jgi:long-chain acyl-CoA synthetase
MPNFIDTILAQMKAAKGRVMLRELRGGEFLSVTGGELLERIEVARNYLKNLGIQPGNRCALLGPNSISWVAVDLALLAEGVITVPLYFRQAPADLVVMLKDSQPKLLLVNNAAAGEAVRQAWIDAPKIITFDEILSSGTASGTGSSLALRSGTEIVTIIYTSGTLGEPKGVCLNLDNLSHMVGCTTERLEQLMNQAPSRTPDSVFHYLPMNFAASWLLLLSCLSRETTLTFSTDLNQLAEEIVQASPHYFLNVPSLLERVRRGVEEALTKRPAPIRTLFQKAKRAWQRKQAGRSGWTDSFWLYLGQTLIFGKIKQRFGHNLVALICGSAPLAPETQQFFLMLGIPVLQAYGLTETTGICTLDDPRVPMKPGFVGYAVRGTEMKLAENQEIVVRGPHIFAGYWNRPEETARVLHDGWFHTGDQGESNENGNWRIVGRIKNLIVLNSGHNIAPEPLEEKIAALVPTVQQIVIVGNGRGYLCVLVCGKIESVKLQTALDTINSELPHYRQIRKFTLVSESFSAENGLLTANGKLRREAINTRFAAQIAAMYEAQAPPQAAKGKTA